MNQIFNCGPMIDRRLRYVTLVSNGVKEEGCAITQEYMEPHLAWEAYQKSFDEYTENAKAIHWRHVPTISVLYQYTDHERFTVYSRLAIA